MGLGLCRKIYIEAVSCPMTYLLSHPSGWLFLYLIMLAVACVPAGDVGQMVPTIHAERWPLTNGGVPIDPVIEKRIDDLLTVMTLEEMVAQTIQAGS